MAASLLTGTKNNLEVAEIAIKVLDWTDTEPFIAYLYIIYIERICHSMKVETNKQLQSILDEILKRV